MGIQVKPEYGKECGLEDHIDYELSGDSYDGGALEAAARTAENTKEAFARLVAILADKGLLDQREVSRIVHNYESGLEFVK